MAITNAAFLFKNDADDDLSNLYLRKDFNKFGKNGKSVSQNVTLILPMLMVIQMSMQLLNVLMSIFS